jgi:hypothetical protein
MAHSKAKLKSSGDTASPTYIKFPIYRTVDIPQQPPNKPIEALSLFT